MYLELLMKRHKPGCNVFYNFSVIPKLNGDLFIISKTEVEGGISVVILLASGTKADHILSIKISTDKEVAILFLLLLILILESIKEKIDHIFSDLQVFMSLKIDIFRDL